MEKTEGVNEAVPQTTPAPTQATTNSNQNLKGALCYILGVFSGIAFLLIEKENKFIRFHAMQSVITFGAVFVISILPVIGWALSTLLAPLSIILVLVLMYKAYQGEKYKLPVIGDFAEKQVEKMG